MTVRFAKISQPTRAAVAFAFFEDMQTTAAAERGGGPDALLRCAYSIAVELPREIRAVCSSDAARWRIGRIRVIGPWGRSVAELPGDPRPEKETEVTAIYRWVLAVEGVPILVEK
jgi:hypothetical protein